MGIASFYINCRKQGADLTLEEVEKLKADWFKMFPEMQMYVIPEFYQDVDAAEFETKKKKKKKKVKEDTDDEDSENLTYKQVLERAAEARTVKTYVARNVAGLIKVKCSKQKALNFPFQSLAALISKRALWLVYLDSIKRGYKIVNFIHDEIIVEVPEERLNEVAESVVSLMIQASKELIPEMNMKAEPAAMRRWTKSAEAEYDEAGNLIPWDDVNHA